MSSISSASSQAVYQAPPPRPPVSQKVDGDGDHDNSPPSEASANSAPRALNVLA